MGNYCTVGFRCTIIVDLKIVQRTCERRKRAKNNHARGGEKESTEEENGTAQAVTQKAAGAFAWKDKEKALRNKIQGVPTSNISRLECPSTAIRISNQEKGQSSFVPFRFRLFPLLPPLSESPPSPILPSPPSIIRLYGVMKTRSIRNQIGFAFTTLVRQHSCLKGYPER